MQVVYPVNEWPLYETKKIYLATCQNTPNNNSGQQLNQSLASADNRLRVQLHVWRFNGLRSDKNK